MFKLGMRSKRSWRPLISVLVAYAVAAQTLLITLSGFALAAHVNPQKQRPSRFVSTMSKASRVCRLGPVIPAAVIAFAVLLDCITR